MKRFAISFLIFSMLALGVTITPIFLVKNKIASGNFFALNDNVRYLFLGQSHMECAFNDSLIPRSKNLAYAGECYLYSYLKIKKIAENNPQIKLVFLVYYLNGNAEKSDGSIWGDNALNGHYSRYSPLITTEEYKIFLPRKLKKILTLELVSLLKNIQFLASKGKNYSQYTHWGGYRYLGMSSLDSLLKNQPNIDSISDSLIIPTIDLSYLYKTIEYLKERNVQVVLVRTPLYPRSNQAENEKLFKTIKNEKLSDTEFLDFVDFPLYNAERADYSHLNYRGARKFSIFFNNLLQQGLLDSVDKQAFINRQMELLKDSEHR